VPRGGTYEILAILILRMQSDRRLVSVTQARRFRAIHQALRADHPFLTGKEDYPACALLCGSTRPPKAIRTGVEALYKAIAGRRFAKGDALQTATHILFLTAEDPARTADCFARVWQSFRDGGLRMKQQNYAAAALLATLATPPRELAHAVERHRTAIRELKPRPDKELSFALAVGTAFAELVRGDPRARTAADVKAMLDVQQTIYAQQVSRSPCSPRRSRRRAAPPPETAARRHGSRPEPTYALRLPRLRTCGAGLRCSTAGSWSE